MSPWYYIPITLQACAYAWVIYLCGKWYIRGYIAAFKEVKHDIWSPGIGWQAMLAVYVTCAFIALGSWAFVQERYVRAGN